MNVVDEDQKPRYLLALRDAEFIGGLDRIHHVATSVRQPDHFRLRALRLEEK